jgi:hypothetical protein
MYIVEHFPSPKYTWEIWTIYMDIDQPVSQSISNNNGHSINYSTTKQFKMYNLIKFVSSFQNVTK